MVLWVGQSYVTVSFPSFFLYSANKVSMIDRQKDRQAYRNKPRNFFQILGAKHNKTTQS